MNSVEDFFVTRTAYHKLTAAWGSNYSKIIMMLGTGVGDILACARLAYKLYQELSETNGFFREYRTISSRLLTVHKALLQVEQLRAANQLTQSTLNAIRFLASKMSEAINGFVNRLEGLRASQAGWSGLALKDIFSPGKPSSEMTDEVILSNICC
ncbi:uncharacterized protein AKAW2_61208S [Aspergillus luchuensis]|uniref:Fungal N-terminal domain-containing protein n=1 Tax=Aspergillus kawachii TaxID=1069201 RepID=A0A7R7WHB4_ASPKA|nr:uncharacterized protein AKAW2_61208S [Aspergillus luchuensis]BCS02944.1 hypothetical protein AKAW2_61208S [Aspergillus luchuensis]